MSFASSMEEVPSDDGDDYGYDDDGDDDDGDSSVGDGTKMRVFSTMTEAFFEEHRLGAKRAAKLLNKGTVDRLINRIKEHMLGLGEFFPGVRTVIINKLLRNVPLLQLLPERVRERESNIINDLRRYTGQVHGSDAGVYLCIRTRDDGTVMRLVGMTSSGLFRKAFYIRDAEKTGET